MEKELDGLRGIHYDHNRRSGRTTRMIDFMIQELFISGYIFIHDHHPTREAREDSLNRLLNRLKSEHHGILEFIRVDKKNLTITLG